MNKKNAVIASILAFAGVASAQSLPDVTSELGNIATEVGGLQSAVWAIGAAVLLLIAGTVLFRLAKSAMGRV